MLKTKKLTHAVLAATAGMLLTVSVQAQDVDNRANVYLGASNYFFDDNSSPDHDLGWNFGAELPVSNRWALGLERIEASADSDDGRWQNDLSLTRLSANYHLLKSGNWQPYLGVGTGYYRLKSERPSRPVTDPSWDFGAGVKYFFNNNFFLRGEGRVYNVHDAGLQDYAVNLAVGYAFGGTAAAATPAAATRAAVDSDGDGVLDNADACANTPAGTKVDARGCEIDTDRDGVVDSKDQCPNTPTTLAVDANGCPILEAQQKRQELLVNFDTNKSEVKPEYDDEIETFAEFLRQYTNTNAVIEGHTDSDGTDAYNQALSERRATAVMNELVSEHNIPASRLSAVGYGESRPVAPNTTADGKESNRRIEAEVSVEIQGQRPR
ncbi:MAG: OmpA family protein [Pseudomonadota bacterium]